MSQEKMIPMLPCASIDDTLEFYTALGFEVTYRQERPNNYGCVKRGEMDLHFFTMKDYEPANSYSSCLVMVEDASALHAIFVENLRVYYGKLPVAGIPRITRPSRKNWGNDYRFNVIDPGGNYIRFIQQNSTDNDASESEALTKAGRMIKSADLLVNGKMDFPAAATMLDKLLSQGEMTVVERLRALVLRAEVALNLDEQPLAGTLLEEARGLTLSDAERESLNDELAQMTTLSELL